jgi:cytochrome b involved in lipid metabolism
LSDSVLELVTAYTPLDNEPMVKFGLKYVETALLSNTAPDRLARAVADEVADLVRRARAAISALDASAAASPFALAALDTLKSEETFPREPLEEIATRCRANDGPASLASEIDAWTARHRGLEHRVCWMLRGTPRHEREKLDPHKDADQLNHAITADFRFEARIVETLAINRIAQAANLANMFRSTKEAETNAVFRFFDTYALYGNVLDWGCDSFRGRAALDRMNQIHGRYYIPNVEMKFVLLQGVFTWLDGMDRIGHRRISDTERRGMVAAFVRMGKGMHIQDLTENYEEMYGFYRDICVATADFKPYKRATFEAILDASLKGQPPAFRQALLVAGRVAMDDTYLSAVGYAEPTKEQKAAVRAFFFTVGSMIETLPYTPYLRSLVNTPVRKDFHHPGILGTNDRSKHMPLAFAHLPNGGLPEGQKPIHSVEEAELVELPEMTWEQVKKHVDEGRTVLVVDGFVLDLTTMRDVHPGGDTILKRWAGKDASRAFGAANHTSGTLVFALNYRIGRIIEKAAEKMPDPLLDVQAAKRAHRDSGVFTATSINFGDLPEE